MSWSLFLEEGTPLTPLGALPAGFNGRILPGGAVRGGHCAEGTLVIQELSLPSFLLRLNFFEFTRRLTLIGRSHEPALVGRQQLQGELSARLEGLGRLHLRRGQYALLGLPPTECRLTLKEGARGESLDVVYREELLRALIPHFPRLEGTLERWGAGKAVALTTHTWATEGMLRLVHEMIGCPYSAGLREVYLETRVRELVLLQVYGACEGTPATRGPFSRREVEGAYAVRDLILQDIEKHYTIGELARRVGLNEYTLKAVFKHVFAVGPFECLLQARMERARELLLQTDLPIKAIASLTGYEYYTSFITAFRKFYGCTPASLQKNEE